LAGGRGGGRAEVSLPDQVTFRPLFRAVRGKTSCLEFKQDENTLA